MPEMTVQEALNRAARHSAAGELAQAEAIYRQVLAIHPNSAPVLHLLGVARARSRDYAQAHSLIARAIELDPAQVDYRINLGNVLQESGRGARAVEVYRQALDISPDRPEIHYNLGNALNAIGDSAPAIQSYQRALDLRPDFIQARLNLANTLVGRGDFAPAIATYRQVLDRGADKYDAWLNLGVAFLKSGDTAAALDANRRAVALRPNSADARKNLGQTFHKLGRYDQAIAELRTAARLSPGSAEILQDLGNALRESGRIDEAAVTYRNAISLRPDFADAHYGLSWALLLKGDLQEGLGEYEWRHRLPEAAGATPAVDRPLWEGSALSGRRILLQAEQGFGDTFFALRYIPEVRARGGRVDVRAPVPLVRLLQQQPGIERLIPNDQPVPGDVLVYRPMMSLPLLFETRVEEIRINVPCITPDAKGVETWKRRLETADPAHRKRVGLVWAGRPTPPNRSIPFTTLRRLLDRPDFGFHSLQKGEQAAEVAGSSVINWDQNIGDFADTAALIANLELVITIDTAVAHLAGAMGRPVWVMLQYAADWRWFRDRGDSPWYPTMRLFRQRKPGDWAGVVDEVSVALTAVT